MPLDTMPPPVLAADDAVAALEALRKAAADAAVGAVFALCAHLGAIAQRRPVDPASAAGLGAAVDAAEAQCLLLAASFRATREVVAAAGIWSC